MVLAGEPMVDQGEERQTEERWQNERKGTRLAEDACDGMPEQTTHKVEKRSYTSQRHDDDRQDGKPLLATLLQTPLFLDATHGEIREIRRQPPRLLWSEGLHQGTIFSGLFHV